MMRRLTIHGSWQVRRRDRAYGKVVQAKARTDARTFKVRALCEACCDSALPASCTARAQLVTRLVFQRRMFVRRHNPYPQPCLKP